MKIGEKQSMNKINAGKNKKNSKVERKYGKKQEAIDIKRRNKMCKRVTLK